MAKLLLFFVLFIVAFLPSFAQSSETQVSQITQIMKKGCRVFLTGKLLNSPQPNYPAEAISTKLVGKVVVGVEIDELGKVTGIISVQGDEILAKSARTAAMSSTFSPTLCDGKPTKTNGIITFNFAPIKLNKQYVKVSTIESFTDVDKDSNYYEAVLFLTENYLISFGYADQKFHPETNLTKGDFAHFLRGTLEMLDKRCQLANKKLDELRIFQSFNPHSLTDFEFNPTAPYSESLKVLLEKYRIVLADESGNFNGDEIMSKKDLMSIWGRIFSDDAIPVNFLSKKDEMTAITRGEFALYLKESLDYLTYKALP